MKRKQLLVGVALLGIGVAVSSPLFKQQIETDLRRRVEQSLATAPIRRFRDVTVEKVDHLDVTLGGAVPTSEDRKQVKPYIQEEVPGVGRVFGDVQVQPVTEPSLTSSPHKPEKNAKTVEDAPSRQQPFSNCCSPTVSSNRSGCRGRGRSGDCRTVIAPAKTRQRDDAAETSSTSPDLQTASSRTGRPVAPLSPPQQPSNLRIVGDASAWSLSGSVANKESSSISNCGTRP